MTKTISVLALCAGALFAQESQPKAVSAPDPGKFYRLEFQVEEVEAGKTVNSRSYFSIATENAKPALIRTGGRIPYNASGTGWDWIQVGVSIDSRNLRQFGNALYIEVDADISTPVTHEGTAAGPSVRQNRWSATVIVPLRKPTVIFSSDDLVSKRKMQVALTATPIQ